MMSTSKPFQTFLSKLYKSSGWALFTVFTWELVEEGLESLIAFVLTNTLALFIAKVLSTVAIVVSTQAIKTGMKKFMFPFIKNLIYKEGNDKLEKVKNFFKLVFANKGTIAGVGIAVISVLQGTGTVDPTTFPAITIKGFNITPLLYYVFMGICIILATWFPETWEKFTARIETAKAEKEAQKLVKEAQKQITTEQKVAKQNEAKEQAKKAKEQAVAEHNKKVEEVKAKLIADAQK